MSELHVRRCIMLHARWLHNVSYIVSNTDSYLVFVCVMLQVQQPIPQQ